MRKKYLLSMFTFIICLSTVAGISYAGEDLGSYITWNSDSTKIGYLDSSTVRVYYNYTAGFGMSKIKFTRAGNAGVDAWKTPLKINRTRGTAALFDIFFLGVSRAEATNNLKFPININAATANWDNSTKMGTASSPCGTKSVYKIADTRIFIVWDTATRNTSSYTLAKWKAIAAHEFGHAAGYDGHNNSSQSNLMYSSSSYYYDVYGTSTPQTADKNHMANVY